MRTAFKLRFGFASHFKSVARAGMIAREGRVFVIASASVMKLQKAASAAFEPKAFEMTACVILDALAPFCVRLSSHNLSCLNASGSPGVAGRIFVRGISASATCTDQPDTGLVGCWLAKLTTTTNELVNLAPVPDVPAFSTPIFNNFDQVETLRVTPVSAIQE